MEKFTAHFIGEDQSDWRCVKCGWYAMGETGNLGRRVFPSRFECVEHIERITFMIDTCAPLTVRGLTDLPRVFAR
jgi:hypothetical protein